MSFFPDSRWFNMNRTRTTPTTRWLSKHWAIGESGCLVTDSTIYPRLYPTWTSTKRIYTSKWKRAEKCCRAVPIISVLSKSALSEKGSLRLARWKWWKNLRYESIVPPIWVETTEICVKKTIVVSVLPSGGLQKEAGRSKRGYVWEFARWWTFTCSSSSPRR